MMRSTILLVLLFSLSACGDKGSSSSDSGKPADSGKSASTGSAAKTAATTAAAASTGDAKPARKAKTTLTAKQIQEAYDETTKVGDFKKHRDMHIAKLGKPMKEDGDKAFWWGIKPAEGAQKEECFEMSASPTKGNSTGGTSDDKCWE